MTVNQNKKQNNNGQATTGQNTQDNSRVDLEELAKKIVALLLRELDIERERIGR